MSKKISEKIKAIREAEEITQRKLANMLGVGEVSIARYEANTRSPNFEVIQKICAAFPHYTLYLMHDAMPKPRTDDQITPAEKMNRDLSSSEKTS